MSGSDPFGALAGAARRRFGAAARIENIQVPTLGGSNRTIIFDLVQGANRRRLVSRQATYAAENSPFISTAHQFRAMQIAWRHGIPVAEPIFEYEPADGMGSGFVSAFVAGETTPKGVQALLGAPEAGRRLATQLGSMMGQLHAMPVEEFGFLADTADRWLELNAPPPRRRCFVHGDLRLGNFLVADLSIVALLDWECAHLGSAVEEVGWLCTRSWRFGRPDLPVGGISHFEPFLSAYKEATEVEPEPDEVRYWEIFGLVRWAILNIMQAEAHVRGERTSVVFAACGRNVALVEYDLMMTLAGRYQ